jgi:predicted nucleotidyltransferase component of viral defense system
MILKGGMFIYTLTEFDSRPTRDMDFMIQCLSNDLNNIHKIMEEICTVDTENSFVLLLVKGTERITADKKYPGVKTKLEGHINNVRVPFFIDVGIDDIIVPSPVMRKITTRLEGFTQPEIYTYSLESTIAEKLDAILQRMETTSRMKDFFDIYYLSNIFDFDGKTLKDAIQMTSEHRGRVLETESFERIS